MYSVFSEAIRHVLFFISRVSLSLAKNGFVYQGIYHDAQSNTLKVKYNFNGQTFDETCDSFIESPYIKSISGKQLTELINKTSEIKSKTKIYKIYLLDETPDIFIIKNTMTNLSAERLLSDIISDSKLLENLEADSLKLIINSAIKLSNSGYSIRSSTLEDEGDSKTHDLTRTIPALRVVK